MEKNTGFPADSIGPVPIVGRRAFTLAQDFKYLTITARLLTYTGGMCQE